MYKDKYRTTSTRLKHWDYSQCGWYFITICTKNSEHFFGKVIDEQMKLSPIGDIADKFWKEIPNHFKNVSLDNHVIMPNHIHGIIIINNSTVQAPNLGVSSQNIEKPKQETPKLGESTAKWKPATIGVIINQYKRIVTINARKSTPKFAWQPRFHDHIIRNDESLKRIREYTINNPAKWHLDKYYESK